MAQDVTRERRRALGQAIEDRRLRMDMSQRDAAVLAAVSDTTWGKLESGGSVGAKTIRGATRALALPDDVIRQILEGAPPSILSDLPVPTRVTADAMSSDVLDLLDQAIATMQTVRQLASDRSRHPLPESAP